MSAPSLPQASQPDVEAALRERIAQQQAALEAAERQIAELTASQRELHGRELALRARVAELEPQQRNSELLSQVRNALANQIELEGLFRAVVEAIASSFGYALVSLYLREGPYLVLQHQVGYDDPIAYIPITQGVSGRVARTGQPAMIADVAADPEFIEATPAIRSEICLPILEGEAVVGVLNVETLGDAVLTEVDLELLREVCTHLTIAVGRARVYDASQRERDFSTTLVDTVDSLVIVLNPAGDIVRFNRTCERATGFRFEEVHRRKFWEVLLPPELHEDARRAIQRYAEGAAPAPFEAPCLTRDGGQRLIAWSNAVIHDQLGEIEYLIGTGRDITEQRRAELELRESTAVLRGFFDHTPFLMGVFELIGDDLFYLAINDTGARRFGHTQESIIGVALSALLDDPRDREMWVSNCRRAAATGRPATFEYQRVFGEKVHWRLATVGPIVGHPGEHPRFAYVVNDMTDRRQAEQALQRSGSRLSTLIESMQAGVLVENEQRGVVLANEALLRLFDIPGLPATLVGSDGGAWVERIRARFTEPEQFAVRVGEVLAAQQVVAAEELALADGRTFERDYVPIIQEGSYAGHLWLYRDITERKQAEVALAEARDAALESSRLKSEFLATVSHEIRTPLNGVIGMAELLLDTPLTADQQRLAHTIDDSAQALLMIINDILDYSKIEAGKLNLDPEDVVVASLLASVTDIVRSRVREKQLGMVVEIGAGVPPLVRGDHGRLRQILLNLVSNAVKFTERGRVSLRVELADSDPSTVALRFLIADTGIGIPEAARARLFQPFSQADGSVTRKYGGTGLGLAISRSLVELMGGSIGCESAEGSGSTFWFLVPLEVSAAASGGQGHAGRAEAAVEHRPLPPSSILVAEDHPVNQQIARRQLARMGMRVEIVGSGREALARFAESPGAFQLVLMDCHMPEMDGYETTRAMRAIERQRGGHVPIVAMTASALQSDRAASLEAGMDDFLSKPVRQQALAAVLERWLADAPESGPPRPEAPADVFDEAILSELRAIDEAEPGAFAELVAMFLAETEPRLAALREAAAGSDLAALVKMAHGLRGSSANMGAALLAERCAQMEELGKAGELAAACALLPGVEAAFVQARDALSALAGDEPAG